MTEQDRPRLTIAEASGEYFVTGERGELVAHAMRPPQRPTVYGVWIPGPGTQPDGGPLVATISRRDDRWVVEGEAGMGVIHAADGDMTYDDIRDAIVISVRAVLKTRKPGVGRSQEDAPVWTMSLAVGLAISTLLIVATIADVIRLAAKSLSN